MKGESKAQSIAVDGLTDLTSLKEESSQISKSPLKKLELGKRRLVEGMGTP